MNFNGCIFVIVDREEDGYVVFELGVIMIYLVEKMGMFLLCDVKCKS